MNKTAFIKQYEGLRLRAYRDSVGVWTVGYGHTGLVGGITPHYGMSISQEQANQLFDEDVNQAQSQMMAVIKVALSTNQKAALTSFVFNLGIGAFKSSTLLRKLNKGDISGTADEFLRWVYGGSAGRKRKLGGLIKRRKAEQRLFLTPDDKKIIDGDLPRPSLKRSRTIKGGMITATGTGVATLSQLLTTLAPQMQDLGAKVSQLGTVIEIATYIGLGLSAVGCGMMIWARIDDFKKGRR